VKANARAGVIRRLGDNAALASLLTTYAANYGDWRKLFTAIDDINRVTADDVLRVARRYFAQKSRTVVYLQLPPGGRLVPRPQGGRP